MDGVIGLKCDRGELTRIMKEMKVPHTRSGKSHIIRSVVEAFWRLGRGNEILLSAPTGMAACQGHSTQTSVGIAQLTA